MSIKPLELTYTFDTDGQTISADSFATLMRKMIEDIAQSTRDLRPFKIATGQEFKAGSMVVLDADGYARPAAPDVPRAVKVQDIPGGGDVIRYRLGTEPPEPRTQVIALINAAEDIRWKMAAIGAKNELDAYRARAAAAAMPDSDAIAEVSAAMGDYDPGSYNNSPLARPTLRAREASSQGGHPGESAPVFVLLLNERDAKDNGVYQLDNGKLTRHADRRGVANVKATYTCPTLGVHFELRDKTSPAGAKMADAADKLSAKVATAARDAERREIDRLLAEDARKTPAFATARRAAVLAYADNVETRDRTDCRPVNRPAFLEAGMADDVAYRCHLYEADRGGSRSPSLAATRFVESYSYDPAMVAAFSAYERARGMR
jgi:hypothetical protein